MGSSEKGGGDKIHNTHINIQCEFVTHLSLVGLLHPSDLLITLFRHPHPLVIAILLHPPSFKLQHVRVFH